MSLSYHSLTVKFYYFLHFIDWDSEAGHFNNDSFVSRDRTWGFMFVYLCFGCKSCIISLFLRVAKESLKCREKLCLGFLLHPGWWGILTELGICLYPHTQRTELNLDYHPALVSFPILWREVLPLHFFWVWYLAQSVYYRMQKFLNANFRSSKICPSSWLYPVFKIFLFYTLSILIFHCCLHVTSVFLRGHFTSEET